METELLTVLKNIAGELSQYKEQFAVYGAFAANCYRRTPRPASEVSFGLSLGSAKKSKKVADGIFANFGMTPSYEWLEGLQSRTGKSVSIVIGSAPAKTGEVELRFYIPSLPWVSKGVRRAQQNIREIGSASFPVIPVDDLIVAKAHALSLQQKSEHDLADLEEIFLGETQLDIPYIMSEFNQLELTLPEKLRNAAPEGLKKYVR